MEGIGERNGCGVLGVREGVLIGALMLGAVTSTHSACRCLPVLGTGCEVIRCQDTATVHLHPPPRFWLRRPYRAADTRTHPMPPTYEPFTR